MATNYGVKYPFITDGLAVAFDPKNRDCWNGNISPTSGYGNEFYNIAPLSYLNTGIPWSTSSSPLTGSLANISGNGSTEFAGCVTDEGYFVMDDASMYIMVESFFTGSGGSTSDDEGTCCIWLNTTDTKYRLFAPITNPGLQYWGKCDGGNWTEQWSGTVTNYENGVAYDPQPGAPANDGNWYYYCFTNPNMWGNNGTSNFKIGTLIGGYTDNTYGQKIGPIQLYNRTLSEVEILENFNRQKGRFGL